MKHFPQNELIELNSLMAKFSVHIDRKLVKTFSQEYKKLLMEVHFKLPHNSLLQQKIKGLETIETELEAGDPGTLKIQLQQHIDDVIYEIDAVNSGLNS